MPSGKLQKRSHLLNYHMCREAQASGIINFAHIDGKDNPADVLVAKSRSSKEWFALLKPLIFWCSDSKNADGAHDGSHIVEGSDVRSPAAAPSSGVGHKRLRFYQMLFRFLAGLSSGSPCVAISATSSLFENNSSSCSVFLSSLILSFDSFNY